MTIPLLYDSMRCVILYQRQIFFSPLFPLVIFTPNPHSLPLHEKKHILCSMKHVIWDWNNMNFPNNTHLLSAVEALQELILSVLKPLVKTGRSFLHQIPDHVIIQKTGEERERVHPNAYRRTIPAYVFIYSYTQVE